MNRKLSVVCSICVISALILTSCGIFSSSSTKAAEKKIEEAVENYFEEMQDGTFTSNDYSDSDYADDAPFEKLSFHQDASQEIMGEAMSVIEYEILSASCDKDLETGTCKVKLTYVDLDTIIDELGDGITPDALSEAVLDKKAPQKEKKIVLDMAAKKSDWVIEDSTEISELLGEPYTQLSFAPDSDEYTEMIELLFTSLANGDTETVDALSQDFDSDDFFEVAPEDIPLWEAFYGAVEFEVTGDPKKYGDLRSVDVTLTFPNMTAISQDLADDDDKMLELMKKYFLNLIKRDDNDETYESVFSPVNEEIISAFSDSTYQVEVEVEFDFLYNDGESDILFADIPTKLFDYPPDEIAMNDAYWNVAELAITELYASGDLSQEEYNWYYSVLFGEGTVTDCTGEELIADTIGCSWCHYAEDNISIEVVTEYDSDVTYYLCYKMYFNSNWEGAAIDFIWLDEEGNQIGDYDGTVRSNSSGGSYVFGDFAMNAFASEKVAPGNYYVKVVAPDGVVISEAGVVVK